jgi:hypothetical protein
MKTLKLSVAVFIIAFFMCSNTWGQVLHQDVVVTFNNVDYGPGIGLVTGTFTYRYTLKLSKEGYIENIHWVVQDCDLHNEFGDKINYIDSGHDTFGILWDFWNNANSYNDPASVNYGRPDGWLDAMMPAEMPLEGTLASLAFKVLCKGKQYTFYASLVQVHMNANGVITANVVKP